MEVEATSGDVEDVKVEQRGRRIVIEHRKRFRLARADEYEVRIRAPHGADAELTVASADVLVSGRLGEVEAKTASGHLKLEALEGDARIRSASGDVEIGSAAGRLDVNTASGDVQVGSAASGATVRSASGEVRFGEVAGRVVVQTASGDHLIGSVADASVDLKSASGDLRIGIKQGSRVFVDARSLSGETTSEVQLEGAETATDGPLVELKAVTMSGDIHVVRV